MRMRNSIGTGLVLMAVGGVLAFAVRAPGSVVQYVDVADLGLILIWAGILVLVMQIVMNRPVRPRRRQRWQGVDYDEGWTEEHDVHRPGYAGETRRLPTIRGDGRPR
jgi:tetrahydromethanopterin S-methyltransferase subunit E